MDELLPRQERRILLASTEDTIELKQLIPEDSADYFLLIDYDRLHLSQFGDITAQKYPSEEAVRKSIDRPVEPNKYRFGVWDNGVMVGSDNLTLRGDGTAELGSWIGKKYLGHHYAARARELLIRFAFDTLLLRQVYSEIAVGNEASRKSVESSGFIFDGEYDGYWRYILNSQVHIN